MKIQKIEYIFKKLPLDHAFMTSSGGVSNSTCLFVRLTTECGLRGYGCGYPTSLTNESAQSSLFFSERFSREIIGKSPLRTEKHTSLYREITYANPSVLTAFDTACWDIIGKYANAPLYELWGFDKPKITSSITIGLASVEDMAKDAKFWARKKFTSLKVKVGPDLEHNVAAIAAIRDAVGGGASIRIDANGAMGLESAIAFSESIANYDIEFIEQPVPDVEGLVHLAHHSPVRIAADESITDLYSFPALLEKGAMHVANIKINKMGGITTSRKMVSVAEAYGVPCMVGCMSETPISIAASLHLALSSANITYADLDTFLFLQHTPATGLKIRKGVLQPTHKPGLGIDVDGGLFKNAKAVEYKKVDKGGN